MKFLFEAPNKKDLGIAEVVFTKGKDTSMYMLENGQRRLSVGVEDRGTLTRRQFIVLMRRIIVLLRANKVRSFALKFSDIQFPQVADDAMEIAELFASNVGMANFEFLKYKTPPDDGWVFIDRVYITGEVSKSVRDGFMIGLAIGEEVNSCRELANTPGGEMTPKKLADAARLVVKGTKATTKILGKMEMKKLGMGAVLGVAQGSDEDPQFIIMEYKGGRAADKPIVLVGKGVTFDTGGLNLKPGRHMYEMHMDMLGGAAVIHTVALAARLGMKRNVIGLIPAVENMPSGSSYRPGDVLKSMSGKTIEILNTDAEGRVILADALTYAERYKPKLVVDVATLTGAAAVALGNRASAIFTSDQNLEKLFRDLGEESGDYVWPLPLWEEYEEDVRGTFGDWANTEKSGSGYGGAIAGAVFLWQFAKKYPWVHMDIAPRMTPAEGEYFAKGALGTPIRLLIKLLERY